MIRRETVLMIFYQIFKFIQLLDIQRLKNNYDRVDVRKSRSRQYL